MRSDAKVFQNPATRKVPAGNAQNLAMLSCSWVRVSEKCRISASAARKSGEPKAGGGAGRNRSPDLRKNGRIWPCCGWIGGSPGKLGGQHPRHHRNGPVHGLFN